MGAQGRSAKAARAVGNPGRRATRILLWLLAVFTALAGAYALLASHSFYRHVIGVDLLGPYNEHLITDVGGLYLGFAVIFTWAARTLAHDLVRASCAGFTLTQGAHVIYHALPLQPFSLIEGTAQTILLEVGLALPLTALALHERNAGSRST